MTDEFAFPDAPRRRVAARRAQARDAEDVRRVLALPEGRRLMRRIFDRCGLYRSSVGGGEGLTFFNEGARAVALWLRDEAAAADPAALLRLYAETLPEGGAAAPAESPETDDGDAESANHERDR